MELFSKRFSDVFFCNGRINIFDDNFFLSLWERGFLQWLPGKMCCISCSKISVSFSASVWIAILPLGRVYVCFILIFFEERSLIRFFISAELFGFISWGILSISLMFVSFLIVQTKSTEVWPFYRDDISSLSVLVFCLLSIGELNWWGVWSRLHVFLFETAEEFFGWFSSHM